MPCAMIDAIQSDARDVARTFLQLASLRPRRPDAPFLASLAQAFSRFPYENVTKIIRTAEESDPWKRLRTPDVILEEHLRLGAGGTCFSLTNFFERVLAFADVEVSPVLCDRSYGPDTHCALIAAIGTKRYLVDPGYLMDEPLLVPERGESVQRGPRGTLRLVRLGESRQLLLITERAGKRRIRYRLRDLPVSRQQFVGRWIDSFGWAQMRHVCISQQARDTQFFLRDGLLRSMQPTSHAQERLGAGDLASAATLFGIDPKLVARAHEIVELQKASYERAHACGRAR
jgi:arylamine N-acetyltransferase